METALLMLVACLLTAILLGMAAFLVWSLLQRVVRRERRRYMRAIRAQVETWRSFEDHAREETRKELEKFRAVVDNNRRSGGEIWNSRTDLRVIKQALASGDIEAGQTLPQVGDLPPIERLRAIDDRIQYLDDATSTSTES